MNYIKKVILENFQSHKYTEIEFDQHLNVIVGPSDQGKTAIIRGIKWALFNEPAGDYFIREGESECSVTIIFNNNVKIKRYKSKNKNRYYIYDSDGNETILEGFGTKVPDEVIEKTSIKKIYLDSETPHSINIGEQLEGPFMLSEKASTRAKAIGKIVGVHIIDEADRDTLKDIVKLKDRKREYKKYLNGLRENLKSYDYLDDLKLKTKRLEEIKIKVLKNQNKLNVLKEKLQNLKNINNEINVCKYHLSKLTNIEKLYDLYNLLNDKIRKYNYSYGRYIKLVKINKDIKLNESIVNSLKNIDKIQEKYNLLSNKGKKYTNLLKLFNQYKLIKENMIRNLNIIEKLKSIETVEINTKLIEEKLNILTDIKKIKENIDILDQRLSKGKIFLNKLSNIEILVNIKDSIDNKYSELKKLHELRCKYNQIINEINYKKTEIEKIKLNINSLVEKYEQILNKFEICPLCYNPIDNNTKKRIINNYK